MPGEVTESVRIVIKTEDGNRLEYASKGSAPRGMLSAFDMLPVKRQAWLLKRMQEVHDKAKAAQPQCVPTEGTLT